MSSLGHFEQFPVEIREQIYARIYSSVIIHCCCSPRNHWDKEYEYEGKPVNHFVKTGYDCSMLDIEPMLRQGSWSLTPMSCTGVIATGANIFSFLRASKAIWYEAEKIAWRNLSLSAGVPQFKSFYFGHLKSLVRSIPGKPPRSNLLHNLHLTLPDADSLAHNIGRSPKSHGLSGYFLAGSACATTLMGLKNLANLKNLSITVPSANSMTRWEFRNFWPSLIHHTGQLDKLEIFIASPQGKEIYFIDGNAKFLASLKVSEDNAQQRMLGAMVLAAQDILTCKSSEPDPPSSLELHKPENVAALSEAAGLCYEAIMGADVPVNSGPVYNFMSRACWYLEQHARASASA